MRCMTASPRCWDIFNLEVQTLGSLLKQEKPDQLEIELEQIREAIKVANADVRENILSLRTTLAEDKSLISAMDEYLEEFGLQTGIETQFSNQIAKDPELYIRCRGAIGVHSSGGFYKCP